MGTVAVKRATLGNRSTPTGRNMNPVFWKFCLFVTIPIICSFLFLNILKADVEKPYRGFPAWMQVIGWSSLAVTLVFTPLGLLRRGNSSLSPIAEDEEALEREL